MGFHVFKSTLPLPLCANKPRRGYYVRSLLCDAVKQVMLGTMTVTQAARHYKIPRTTIQKHFSKAREQHNLKDLYIRRMEVLQQDLGELPESVFQQQLSVHVTAFLLSYGVNISPTSHGEVSTPLHWRQQPVRVTLSPRCDVRAMRVSSLNCEKSFAFAEHFKIRNDDIDCYKHGVTLHEERNKSKEHASCS